MTEESTCTASHGEAVGAQWESLLGARLGRYTVQRRLGAGAMGVVYGGLDPKLGREVAIKVSHEQRARDLRRFAREAQAMAAIEHPNVVTVFDYGVWKQQPYVVMAVLPGGTLREACADVDFERRMALLLEAGRGLSAAHRVGVVHRDFKPTNVLLNAVGAAVVTDFGLAVFDEAATDTDSVPEASTRRTQGAGTPAYMSPEQHAGEATDARSDQYSFCITAVEMLTGDRPFRSDARGGLWGSKQRGLDAACVQTLPRAVRHALHRGLQARPEDRFVDMSELLAALRAPPHSGRRVAAVAALAAASIGAMAGLSSASGFGERCPSQDMPAWDTQARTELHESSTTRRTDTKSFARTFELLDAHATTWTQARRRACELERAPAVFTCLDARAEAFAALVNRLRRRQTSGSKAVALAVNLQSASACLEDPQDAVLDESSAAFVTELRRLRHDAQAQLSQGKPEEARRLLERSVGAAERIGPAPVRAKQLIRTADLLDTAGAPERAHALLLEAMRTAGQDDQVDAMAAIALGWVVGVSLEDVDGGLRWLERALISMERFDAPLNLKLLAHSRAATLDAERGELAAAIERLRDARKLVREAPLPVEATLRADRLGRWAELEHNLCTVQAWNTEPEQALVSCQRAVALFEMALHDEHPELSASLAGIYEAGVATNRFDLASAAASRNLALLTAARGNEHPSLAPLHKQLADLAFGQSELDQASEHLGRAIELLPATEPLRIHYEADRIDLLVAMGARSRASDLATPLLHRVEQDRRPEIRAPRAGVLRAVASLRIEDDPLEAIAAIERAYEAGEGTPFLADNVVNFASTAAAVYLNAGDPASAIEASERAQPFDQLTASEARVLLHDRVLAHLQLGHVTAAQDTLDTLTAIIGAEDELVHELAQLVVPPTSTATSGSRQ